MFRWLNQLRDRWTERRAERQATAGERALKQNEAEALKMRDERRQREGGKGPMSGPGI
jgi:hypothetical protein